MKGWQNISWAFVLFLYKQPNGKAKFRGLLRKITDSLNTVWASFMEPHQRLVMKTYVDTVDNPFTINNYESEDGCKGAEMGNYSYMIRL